ncbi:hypothetical protein, partial [Algoriphagus sp.]|uniref:hypothetical protein n=1 Tax=Algoriphagus sp. TaxID=1872435 RepID=UPI0025F5E668
MTAGTSFGVGFSESSDSRKAGIQASKEALVKAELSAEEVQLCFLFCTSRHDPIDFFEGVKSGLNPKVQFFGGFANGTCT